MKIKKFLSKYYDFSGGANRKEYILIQLFSIILFIVVSMLPNLIFNRIIAQFIVILLCFPPNLAVISRRCHDIGEPARYIMWTSFSFRLWGEPSQKGENEYGPSPGV